jgi:hypothetical protein
VLPDLTVMLVRAVEVGYGAVGSVGFQDVDTDQRFPAFVGHNARYGYLCLQGNDTEKHKKESDRYEYCFFHLRKVFGFTELLLYPIVLQRKK